MSDVRTLVQASRLYYELGETQERIADILHVTRPQVSRLLKEARAEGIVEIRVIDATQELPEIAARLRERFGLRLAAVAPKLAGPGDLSRRLVGRRAAQLLRDFIHEGSIVGVGDGAAMAATADALEDGIPPVHATFVPLSGGGFSAPWKDPVRRIAEAFGGQALDLFAPGLVENEATREVLLDHLGNQTVARAWEQMDLALFGIGSYVRSEAWFGEQLLAELDAAGTVGAIMISPFDIQGRFVSDRLRTMVIGMDARDLKRVPIRIAAASGVDKVRPILGALRTGLITDLVTDAQTAEEVLTLAAATRPDGEGVTQPPASAGKSRGRPAPRQPGRDGALPDPIHAGTSR
jgi:DNA-binding transcriptional regulator LsrR (DeoR family)